MGGGVSSPMWAMTDPLVASCASQICPTPGTTWGVGGVLKLDSWASLPEILIQLFWGGRQESGTPGDGTQAAVD